MAPISWKQAAFPQPDGSDTEIVKTLVRLPDRPGPEQVTMFDNRTTVMPVEGGFQRPRYVPAPARHPNYRRAEALLQSWPEIYEQCGELLFVVHPYNDTSRTADKWRVAYGSSSHCFDLGFGSVRVTIDNAFGLAQALVHEMSHQKLRAFGVDQSSADRLVANDPTEVFDSPIVLHQRRPMTAVVHAQYSFMHVTALDVAMFEHATDDETRSASLELLARNLPRMEMGRIELERHLRTDNEGKMFFSAFDEWSEDILRRGRFILEKNDMSGVSSVFSLIELAKRLSLASSVT
jgi:hypothetical protein